MARPSKQQQKERAEIEAITKRDNIEYLEFEQKCINIANEFNDDCFMAYEMAHACMDRAYIFDCRLSAFRMQKVYYDNGETPETQYLKLLKHSKQRFLKPMNFFMYSQYHKGMDFDSAENRDENDMYEISASLREKFKEIIVNDEILKYGLHEIENMPIFLTSSHSRKAALVQIDFTKPIEEITATVSTLKRHFDKNPEIISSLEQYLKIEPEKKPYFCTIKQCEIYKHKDPKPLEGRLADALFIYDCKRLGLTKDYAMVNINEYWFNKLQIETHISERTYKEYLKFAKKQIDEKGFKDFLTGVKNHQ